MTDRTTESAPATGVDEPAVATVAAERGLDATVLKIAGVIVIGAIMSILDVTVVSVALPTFAAEFRTTYASVAWTMTGYTLALASVIPLTGWAADRFGTKRLYLTALVLFVAGSMLCSVAWDITSLIVFRVLQGFGGGMLMPLGMTILTRAAGPDRIGRVMAVLGVPMLLGPIAGPILGGWLIDAASWHWIFLINVPIGIVALIAAWTILPKDAPQPSQSFDVVGMLLLSPGLALFLFGVSSIPETGTVLSARVLVSAVVGLALVAAFVVHALRVEHPLIDLRLFRNRALSVAVVAMSLFAIAFFGAGLIFPSYFLQVRGETTLAAGLLLAPQGLGAMVSMPIAGNLADRIGPGRIVITGMALVTAGMAVFTQVGPSTSYVILLGGLFVMGLGLGATMMPIMTAALQTLDDASVARGSTLMNIIQQSAGSVGTAVISVVLTNQLLDRAAAGPAMAAQNDPEIAAALPPGAVETGLAQAADAFGSTFLVATIIVAFTFVPAFLLPRRKVTPTAGSGAAPTLLH
ncbi:DHA2 family efflux MFS transporter permease subunit [Rhodococcoides corynebacterioides]|uniref:DHA2 family efflux MFS transporter permease subunit n=1 Tax=Rhodococcoides corynebacterioides TaxID=53972 RepID=UPI0009EDEC70|nr:DHA2 family efflux MFS transporter permease subunit [Rhodococcus corynebacterioides]MBY6349881.1 DHA2 family efflux MFS transporter permease subunit [Rhodococcus corynebacterioides]MBY6363793.1 DHA2 family efflux MFS transporter permease subunit [Rhodococcus corynebacterioides]